MRRNEEHYLQQSMVRWFDVQHPTLRLNLFAVPNGANTSQKAGAYMKSEGLRSGVADLVFCYNGSTYFIEVKTAKGKQQPSQKEFEGMCDKHGFPYVIVRSLDEFMEFIKKIV